MVPVVSLHSGLDAPMLNAVPAGSEAVSVTPVDSESPELVTPLA